MGTDFPWNATEEEQGQTKATVVLVFISFFYSWRIRDLYATSTDLVSASVSHLPVSGNRRPGCMPSRASVERTWTAQWGIEIDGCFRACFCNLFSSTCPLQFMTLLFLAYTGKPVGYLEWRVVSWRAAHVEEAVV